MRFPEFTDEWTKHVLGQLGETIIGLTYSPSNVVSKGGVIVLRSSNIKNGCLDYNDIVRVDKKIKPCLYTQVDDILICARNGSARLIGKNAILEKSDSGHTFGAFMMIYRSTQNRFIHHLLHTKRYFSQVSENLGARINQITTSDFNSFEFYFPENNEAIKIAKFIDLLDERIATQRRIIEDLEELKSAISKKLFGNLSGYKVVKLGSICRISTGKLDANAMTIDGQYMFFTCSKDHYKTDSYAFEGEALLIAGNGDIGHVQYYEGKFNAYQRTYVLLHFTENIKYLQFYIEYHLPYRVIKEKNVGVMPYIVLSTLTDMLVQLPNIEVQNHVAQLLGNVDNKLQTERAISNLYSLQKRFLLYRMFI